MTRRSRRTLWLVIAAGLLAVVVALVFAVATAQRWFHTVSAQPPGVGTVVLAPQNSKVQQALAHLTMDADSAAATEYLAAQPTAYWLTPEQDPPGAVGATTSRLLAQARADDSTLAVVVYGLPERDCGNHSAGGLATETYPSWIAEIAAALETGPDLQKIVVLEPDSLSLATECGDLDERFAQLRDLLLLHTVVECYS